MYFKDVPEPSIFGFPFLSLYFSIQKNDKTLFFQSQVFLLIPFYVVLKLTSGTSLSIFVLNLIQTGSDVWSDFIRLISSYFN